MRCRLNVDYNDLDRYAIGVIIDGEDFTGRLLNQRISTANFAKAVVVSSGGEFPSQVEAGQSQSQEKSRERATQGNLYPSGAE